MRERAHTTGDQRCAQTAQTGHAHRKQREHRNSGVPGPRWWAQDQRQQYSGRCHVGAGSNIKFTLYKIYKKLANSLEKNPQYFLRGRNRKCTRKNVLFYFLNVAYKTDSEQFASDWRSYNVSQYKYSASRLKSTKFCSKRWTVIRYSDNKGLV